jgi:hypothetical protein
MSTDVALGPAEAAEHDALRAQKFCRFSIRHKVREPLQDFFVGRGEKVEELALDVDDVANVESWSVEWRAAAADAGITSEFDTIRFVGWLEARFALDPSAAIEAGTTIAQEEKRKKAAYEEIC